VVDQAADTRTLLFTDIVGSTRLWEDHPDGMRDALATHNDLLRAAIEHEGGYIFKTVGDAFCASFTIAGAALAAAVRGQLALEAEPWPEDVRIQVRMGIHSGVCVERDGDYFGPVVNRVARLESIAHGGQVVLSEATAALLVGVLPADTELRDRGLHRLKDLGRPEHVFEVRSPGLATEFPPLRSLENPDLPNNLPEQVSNFIGRVGELVEIRELINRARMVTLVGAGGAGKTRLALQVAAELLDGSGGGVWSIELAAIVDPELVTSAVATALGLREEPRRPLMETVTDSIGDRDILLVFDNCEHLIGAVAATVDRLLRACPHVHILATSRQPIFIDSERVYRVPSLALPPAEPSEASLQFDALQFFIDRAQQHQPAFVIDEKSIPVMIDLCRRLDGIPMAIELAAVRLQSLSLYEIHRRLDDRFKLLTGGSRTALPRQQTLRATVDWSYDLLGEREMLVLSHLSVFAGGFTGDAAEAIFAGDAFERFDVVEILGSLSDKSLVHPDLNHSDRFHLHDTIRQYAAERLVERGESARHAAREAHARIYLSLAERAAPHLLSAQQRVWLDRLELERDNLRVAVSYFLGTPSRHEQALRFGIALRRFWHARGYWAEGSDVLTAALDLPGAHAPRRLRASALCAAGLMCARRSDHAAAQERYRETLQIARALGDDALVAEALGGLAWAALSLGDRPLAVPLIEESLEHARRAGDPQVLGLILERCASVNYDDLDTCRSNYAEALEHLVLAEDLFSVGIVENNMADLELLQGNPERARAHLENAIAISHELNDKSVVYCYLNLGTVGVLTGDAGAARRSYLDAYGGARRTGDQFIIANAVLGFALCLSVDGLDEHAAELHGVADELMAQLGAVHEVGEAKRRVEDHARLTQRLGEAAFGAAYAAGRALPPAEGIARAVESGTRALTPGAAPPA
jgi:predicted ATPase/class 3 adenylate cyclase